jgi:hypothetical protein
VSEIPCIQFSGSSPYRSDRISSGGKTFSVVSVPCWGLSVQVSSP